MKERSLKFTKDLISFIENSPTAFHAVDSIEEILKKDGFLPLNEADVWQLKAGQGYYVTRNRSSVIAFRVPTDAPHNFLISASHTDSPIFKLKENCESTDGGDCVRLNVELSGGAILASWLDRPLSLAGRVILNENGRFTAKNVKFDRDLLVIPNVAIHQNRKINSEHAFNVAKDMLPVFALQGENVTTVRALLAKELSCEATQIAGMDLYVVCREKGSIWGANDEFFSAPRIDDLMCAYGTLKGFCGSSPAARTVTVYFSADNEETGSQTKQGAGSVFLSDVLARICEATGGDKRRMLASSMMLSADNAHAVHPNYPELSDKQNAPRINGGVVIKANATQKYTTDGFSAALFKEICRRADVPVQRFHNRSDVSGGSTLGNIANTHVPLCTVDFGMAQLAMHSAYESAGVDDVEHLIRAIKAFYSVRLTSDGDGVYQLENLV
ncbi:MAG: M18 family aminopeptidase [Clostridia bacterium]|nr:M18 family aminopeptidase [Clostridia bacterium]